LSTIYILAGTNKSQRKLGDENLLNLHFDKFTLWKCELVSTRKEAKTQTNTEKVKVKWTRDKCVMNWCNVLLNTFEVISFFEVADTKTKIVSRLKPNLAVVPDTFFCVHVIHEKYFKPSLIFN
jgi:hypothetical protein